VSSQPKGLAQVHYLEEFGAALPSPRDSLFLNGLRTMWPERYQHTEATRSGENGGGVSILIHRELGIDESRVIVKRGIALIFITINFDSLPQQMRFISGCIPTRAFVVKDS
jgi:hypothetical protein